MVNTQQSIAYSIPEANIGFSTRLERIQFSFFLCCFAALDCKYQERHNTWSPCRLMDKGPIQHAQCCIKDHCISRVNMTPTFEHSLAIHGLQRMPWRQQRRNCLSSRKWGAMLRLTTLHPAIYAADACLWAASRPESVSADIGPN